MKISIASDHGGFLLKEELKNYLTSLGHEVVDCGTYSLDSCDYPDFAEKAARLVSDGTCQRGIEVCTTGEGVSICANKVPGIRCGLIYNEEVSVLTREHNDVNMIAIGAKFTSFEEAKKYVDNFLNTPFAGDRHTRRVNKMNSIH
ncbi:MAG: ribose 5-phosphate isomerase B [Bacilli bacterium]